MNFLIVSVTPMELYYLSKLQIFICYLNKNIEKNCNMFKGGEKIRQASAIFFVSSIYLSLNMILFESFDIL
jgi:hypothetical protein